MASTAEESNTVSADGSNAASPTDAQQVEAKKKSRLKTTFGYLHLLVSESPTKQDYLLLITGVVFSIAAGIPFPLLGILFGQLVDDLNSNSCSASSSSTDTSAAVSQKVLDVVYVTIANFVFIYLHTGAWSLFGERLVRRLRKGYLNALLRQEIGYFETLPSGEVSSRLDADLHAIQSGCSEKVGIVIGSVSYFVTAYVVAFMKDAKLAGMLVALLPAYFLMAFAGNYFTKKYAGAVEEKITAANSIASEALSHIKLVKAFGAGKAIENIFVERLTSTRKAVIGKVLTMATQMGLLYFIAYSANALAISQGGRQIADTIANGGDGLTVGHVYTVIFVLVDASFIISQVAPFLAIFGGASTAADKLFTTMYRQSKVDGADADAGLKLSEVEGTVELRDVSFRYPSRPEVLAIDKLNIHIPAKKMTGIVGLSGSGKSTVAAFVERLYDPNEGQVFLDGHDLKELNPRHLRGHMGLIEQNPVLLDRSILENVAHGLVGSSKTGHEALEATLTTDALSKIAQQARDGADLDQLVSQSESLTQVLALVKEAIRLAGASDFVANLHHGLATSVGTAGGHLSGGQKQRIALARALVRDPAILILDEATASLDSATEAMIQRALESLPGERTIICIAHRLSTVKNAHNIIVMQQGGKVVEQGTYDELVSNDGVFSSMVQLQSFKAGEHDSSERTSIETKVPAKDDAVVAAVDQEKAVAFAPSADKDADTSSASTPKDAESKEERRSFLSTFGTIVKMARRQLLFMVAGVFCAAIVGGSHAGEAVIFGNTIGRLNICRSAHSVRSSGDLFGLLFFLLAIVEFFANLISAGSFGWVADKLLLKTRTLSLRALLSRDLEWHESEGRTAGTLMSYISADSTAMSGLTGTILGTTFSVIVNLVAGIVLAHVVAWKIAVVLLACVPVLLASGFLRLRIQAQFAERHAKAFAHSVSIATEAVTSIRTVTAFSLQEEVGNTFNRSLKEPYDATLKSIAYGNFWLAMAFSVGNLVYALAYWWGSRLTGDGEYSQTQFFIVLPALLFAAQTSGQLFSLAPDASKAAVAARRVLALIYSSAEERKLAAANDVVSDDNEKAASGSTAPSSSESGMAISFRDVAFSYPSRPTLPVLKGISFDVPAGSFAAFVGTSGAGKSTIMSLLEHFYVPSSGSVLLDGYDIASVAPSSPTPPSMLNAVGLVPQEPILFSGSVAFNIGLGARPGTIAAQAEIEAAARLACIHDTITALPQSYETNCGPAGAQAFSGGQKQRICIARALVRQPRLLLLDESSSALDAESESLWEKALEDIRARKAGQDGWGGVTVVAIAHRLRTIMKADRIFVMEHGQIVDAGTHAELMVPGRCDKYRNDVVHQSLE